MAIGKFWILLVMRVVTVPKTNASLKVLDYKPEQHNPFTDLISGQHIALIPSLTLESGCVLKSFQVAYKTWGQLNATRDNVLIVCHALSGSSDVADWWGPLIGPGKALDYSRFFIFCGNALGSPYGSASPLTTNIDTGLPYGHEFPTTSVRDDVMAHRLVLDALGISSVAAVIGGSMGGMTTIEWPLCTPPGFVKAIIPIATSASQTAWGISWSEIQRQCIYSDPAFHGGYYDPAHQPTSGLATARKVAMLTYRSGDSFEKRFGRKPSSQSESLIPAAAPTCHASSPMMRLFSAQDYLDYQGNKFLRRFDANCYLHLTHKMDMHDVRRGRVPEDQDPHLNGKNTPPGNTTATVLLRVPSHSLVVGIESDVLFLPAQQLELAACLPDATLAMLKSSDGHDAFLIEYEQLNHLILDMLKCRFPDMYSTITERMAEIDVSHLTNGLSVDFRQGQPRALRYGDEFLAVGLSSGTVLLYYTTSYQEYKVLEHGEAVKFIAFKPKTELVATCGMKMVKVWDIRSGQVVQSLETPPRPLGMEFDVGRILIASGHNYVATWDLGDNIRLESVRRPWYDADIPEMNRMPRGTPCALALSTSHKMLAVAYSGQPITLWDIEEDTYAGSCGKKLSNGETSTHVVVALAFNPNPDISLLAVTYLDGDLVFLDPFADRQLECFRGNCQTLAPSPNGRLLAAGGANGIIHVYEFDTLKLLYQVKSSNSYIKQLAFTRDSMLLADIRGVQCTVWEPEALLRKSMSDDSSGATFTTVVEAVSMEAKAKITAMVIHHTSEVIFYGKDDGSVVLYERKTAASLGTLYSHKSPVRLLAWIEQRDALLSIDASNRIFVHTIHNSEDKGWLCNMTVLFKAHLDSDKAITDVLVGGTAAKFLVSTRESDHLFSLDSGTHERERTYPQMPGIRKWISHPESSLHLVCVNNFKACTYCWCDWSEVSSIALSLDGKAELKSATLYFHWL
ncbi:hypothetical protein LT330_005151 [Penicillium expansum]|nr:hypothetical protein LT330_005151 [Penicillium expansum]